MFGVSFRREIHSWLQDQWSFVFSNFGVEEIYERGFKQDDQKIYQATIPIQTCADLPGGRPLVVLASQEARYIRGEINLLEFEHPENAIYVFGGSHENLNVEADFGGREPEHLVYIPTTKHELFAHVAGAITLYDRLAKWQTKSQTTAP